MDFEPDLRTGRNLYADVGFPRVATRPRRETGERRYHRFPAAAVTLRSQTATRQLAAVVIDGNVRLEPHQKAFLIKDRFLLGLSAQFGQFLLAQLGLIALRRRHDERNDVMHDLAIAGPRLGPEHVTILCDIQRDFKILVLVRAAGIQSEFIRHCQHQIRLADTPAFDELRRRRQIIGLPFLRSAINPVRNLVNLGLAQPPVVCPLADVRIGVPGRHLAADDLLANGPGPGPRVFVAQYREGRCFTGAVTLDTALEEDRGDVFVESDRLSAAGRAPGDERESGRQDNGNGDNRAGPKAMMFNLFHSDLLLSEMRLVVKTRRYGTGSGSDLVRSERAPHEGARSLPLPVPYP